MRHFRHRIHQIILDFSAKSAKARWIMSCEPEKKTGLPGIGPRRETGVWLHDPNLDPSIVSAPTAGGVGFSWRRRTCPHRPQAASRDSVPTHQDISCRHRSTHGEIEIVRLFAGVVSVAFDYCARLRTGSENFREALQSDVGPA